MIHITDTTVFGFEPALHGMRNPKESWDRSDSAFYDLGLIPFSGMFHNVPECPWLGDDDLDLMRRLLIGGSEHRKFLRAIGIWAFIEPDRGCWQEIDTYKISTVRNSCSTMHKLGTRPLTSEDFYDGIVLPETLAELNRLGAEYRVAGDFKLVERMKRILPEGFIQGADYHMNYENALNMFFQRKAHRLPEWRWTGLDVKGCGCHLVGHTDTETVRCRVSICDWIWSLPYMDKMISWIMTSEKDKAEALREEGREEVRWQHAQDELRRKHAQGCVAEEARREAIEISDGRR